jgi:hypothetical protein
VPRALAVEDTDWHLDRLYDFVRELGASVLITPQMSRYVIDLNRPPDDAPMYPGASNTELCPTRFFTGDPLYLPGAAARCGRARCSGASSTGSPTTTPCGRAGRASRRSMALPAVGRPQHPQRNPLAV